MSYPALHRNQKKWGTIEIARVLNNSATTKTVQSTHCKVKRVTTSVNDDMRIPILISFQRGLRLISPRLTRQIIVSAVKRNTSHCIKILLRLLDESSSNYLISLYAGHPNWVSRWTRELRILRSPVLWRCRCHGDPGCALFVLLLLTVSLLLARFSRFCKKLRHKASRMFIIYSHVMRPAIEQFY